MIRWAESGGVTTKLFQDALHTMDTLGLFPRDDNVVPFGIFDGHGSRLEYPFLQYINNPDHKWSVCVGVPYGTAYWQVRRKS